MSEVRLLAEIRTEFGKGGARRTRRAGKIPAVLYGHGTDPRHLSLPARDFSHALKGGANTVLTLQFPDGDELALPKSVVRHPLRDYVEHVDLLLIRRGEKVTVDIQVDHHRRSRRRHPGADRPEHAVGRGRGHEHPGEPDRRHRGRRGRHPVPGRRRHRCPPVPS